ncbi:MAG: glutathione synthase, partial [Gammaproteobacteria bacterium]|nr:glutathione synthase [Gammaproteobacteria bacterium]
MTIKLGVVMDPISAIDVEQDSTMAMLLEAEKRGWQLYYMEQKDLFIKDSVPMARMRKLSVFVEQEQWFELTEAEEVALSSLNVILMRKDPPVDLEYIYATHILELAEAAGALVLNRPQSLRDANEKLFAAWFPECCPPTVVAKDAALLQDFIQTHKKVVLKPLHGMGGMGVFQV